MITHISGAFGGRFFEIGRNPGHVTSLTQICPTLMRIEVMHMACIPTHAQFPLLIGHAFPTKKRDLPKTKKPTPERERAGAPQPKPGARNSRVPNERRDIAHFFSSPLMFSLHFCSIQEAKSCGIPKMQELCLAQKWDLKARSTYHPINTKTPQPKPGRLYR